MGAAVDFCFGKTAAFVDAAACSAAAVVDRGLADLEVVAGQVVDFVAKSSMAH